MQIPVNYFNRFKVTMLLALALLLAMAGTWLAHTDSSTTPIEAGPVKLQSRQHSPIEHQPLQNTAAAHNVLSSEEPEAASAGNTGQLVIMPRPDWALDNNLLAHFSQLALAAKQGDSEAAYVLGMNLRSCYVVPQDAAVLAERLQQAYQFNDNGEAAAHITERYDFCLGVDKQQRSQFYAYLAMAASKGFVPAQEAIAMITPEQYMNAVGY